ncbi:hypothetical protein ACFSAG_14090 [Sphingorhabdus buctiana]|uniref:DUF3102 domain-containing protein n=1 Tax=Sphingorhabdus buctiana TaxID=1508805 RepID=A0ABW4MG55_9SPHN
MATDSGRPLASEAESILAKHLSRRKETNALLDRIADRIAELEEQAHGKWHKNLKAWAAVSEMLARVIEDDKPEKVKDDEVVQEVRDRLNEHERLRLTAVALLANLGVSIRVDPKPAPLLGYKHRRGIFGRSQPEPQSSRLWEQAAINAMPDGKAKEECQDLFSSVLKLDAAINQLEAEEAEAMRPLIEAEQEGRRLVTPPNALLGLLATSNINPNAFRGRLYELLPSQFGEEEKEGSKD